MNDPDASSPCFTNALFDLAVEPAEIDPVYERLRDFCHLVRNHLNNLKLSFYLAKRVGLADRVPDWANIERRYRAMEAFVEEFHTACRPVRLLPIRMDLGLFLDEKVAAWRSRFEARGRSIELIRPQETSEGLFDPSALSLALDAIAEWRAEEGAPEAPCRLIYWVRDGEFTLVWDEPLIGRPMEVPRDPSLPSSLALPMTARLFGAHAGSVQLCMAEGWRLRLRWPVLGPPTSVLPATIDAAAALGDLALWRATHPAG